MEELNFNSITALITAVLGVVCLIVGVLAKTGRLAKLGAYEKSNVVDVESYGNTVGNVMLVLAVLSIAAAVVEVLVTGALWPQAVANVVLVTALVIAAITLRGSEKKYSATPVRGRSGDPDWK